MQIFTQTGALLQGHFILTSGRHSNQYMQCARVLQYPDYTEQLARVLAGYYNDDRIDWSSRRQWEESLLPMK